MAILCNQCGESCESPHHPFPEEGTEADRAYGLIQQKVRGHYCSTALTDLTEYTFSLCEPCLKKLFGGFKIPVQEAEYEITLGRPLTEEEKQEWREYLNSPAYKISTQMMHAIIEACPGHNTGESDAPVYLSPDLWEAIKPCSDLVDEYAPGPTNPDGRIASIHGIPLWIDSGLTGRTVRVEGKTIDVTTVKTLLG